MFNAIVKLFDVYQGTFTLFVLDLVKCVLKEKDRFLLSWKLIVSLISFYGLSTLCRLFKAETFWIPRIFFFHIFLKANIALTVFGE